MQRINRPFIGIIAMLALLMVGLVLPLGTPALAQSVPTATPNDPIWRGFSALRDAIEEARSVDLTLVKSYDWEQSEWKGGIDTCVDLEDITTARKIYFGWTYTITSLRGDVFQGRISFDLKELAVCDHIDAGAAPAPAANDTANPDLPPPVAGSAAGGSFELGGQALDMSLNTLGLMNRAGMKWAKQQVQFAWVIIRARLPIRLILPTQTASRFF